MAGSLLHSSAADDVNGKNAAPSRSDSPAKATLGLGTVSGRAAAILDLGASGLGGGQRATVCFNANIK